MRLPRTLHATRAGWCFVAIVFGVGFAALNTGNNLLYLVLSLLLAFLVLSGLLSESSLRGLRVERRLPREIFAQMPNRIVLLIHNTQGRTPSFAVSIEDQIAGPDRTQFAGRAFALRIGPGESISRSYDFVPTRRGDLSFARCRLSTRFPFGLFVKSIDLQIESSALVYPAIRDTSAEQPTARTTEDGAQRKRVSRDGDELSGVRDYAAGDRVQRIHWRRSLRARRLIVGAREGESSAQIEVPLPLPTHLSAAEVEARVTLAASEVVQHLANGCAVGLRSARNHFRPDAGFAHRTVLLSYLARVRPEAAEADDVTPVEASG